MLLTLRTTNTHGNARSTADAVITALSPAAWYRNATDVVSSGGFASIWADYASSDKGLVSPNVTANNASTPDTVPLSIAGDETLIIRLLHSANTGVQYWMSNYNGTTAGSVIYTNASNTPNYVSGGTNPIAVAASAAQPYGTGVNFWLKVTCDADNGASGSTVRFYTAADQASVPSSWTQLGTDRVTAGVHSRADTATALSVGGNAGVPFSGIVYRAILQNGIDGTTVFDADFSAQAIGTASFTESSSNAATVTINTSGAAPAHIGKARDLLQGTGTNQPAYAAGVFTGDGADNFMQATSWSMVQPCTIVYVGSQESWTDQDVIFDGTANNTGKFYQVTATPNMAAYAGTALVATNPDTALGTSAIFAVVFNGASSSVRTNNNAKVTANAGAGNMGGFTLFRIGAFAGNYGHATAKEIVIFPSALSDANQDAVITALNNALTVF